MRFLALLGVAGLLASTAALAPTQAAACGWYVYHYGNVYSSSVTDWNQAGKRTYVNAQTQVLLNSCNDYDWQVRTRYWVSDGTVVTFHEYERLGFQGQSGIWGSGSAIVNSASTYGFTQVVFGYDDVAWGDDSGAYFYNAGMVPSSDYLPSGA